MRGYLKDIIIGIVSVAVVVVTLVLLLPVEKNQQLREKYGKLAINAETDERAKYILDNVSEYPDDVLRYYYNITDNTDFVYNYLEHRNDYASMSFTDDELNSPYPPKLYMSDFRWAYQNIGNSFIYHDGCAAVAITMANLYLTKSGELDPYKVALAAEDLGVLAGTGGIETAGVKELCEELGLNAVEYNYDTDIGGSDETVDYELIRSITENGHVCLLGMFGERFGAHAVVVRECTDEGIYINDPGSVDNTELLWDYSYVEPEIIYVWDISKSE